MITGTGNHILQQISQHTAILIFSRTAREEASAKQFGRHLTAAQNLRVAQLLIRRTQRMARRTGLRVFTVSGAQQRGNTFGQRFTNAIGAIFSKGYERVITIGTDCPGLNPQILLDAAQQLAQDKIVSGADHQGGIYFLGLSRSHFHPGLLSELPWQTGQDFNEIRRYAQKQGVELIAGSVLYDVDSDLDLKLALQNGPSGCRLLRQLRRLLQATQHLFNEPIGPAAIAVFRPYDLRGPPTLLLR